MAGSRSRCSTGVPPVATTRRRYLGRATLPDAFALIPPIALGSAVFLVPVAVGATVFVLAALLFRIPEEEDREALRALLQRTPLARLRPGSSD